MSVAPDARAFFDARGVNQVRAELAARQIPGHLYEQAILWLAEQDDMAAKAQAAADGRRAETERQRDRRERLRTALSVAAILLSLLALLRSFFR